MKDPTKYLEKIFKIVFEKFSVTNHRQMDTRMDIRTHTLIDIKGRIMEKKPETFNLRLSLT